MADSTPVKIAILWHMHQPNYQAPHSNRLILPWVRLHATKDYLDMPLMAAKYDQIKVTFNLVPALLEQILMYLDGGTDPHLELTEIPAEQLSQEQKKEILSTFFHAPVKTMIEPYERYFQLYRKMLDNKSQPVLPALFTSEEMRDIQVWSNLVWIDPLFRQEKPVHSLFIKEKNYTEDDKLELIKWQKDLMSRIVPTYVELFRDKKIGLSFTPYYHPILPLLCDSHTAKEALPDITLPQERYKYPEDAVWQVKNACRLFEDLFETSLRGMWPSEGSVSEETLDILKRLNIKWAATDEEVLFNSLRKSGLSPASFSKYSVYKHNDVHLFFRDHALSDRIGFVYSGMTPAKAVDDFINQIYEIRSYHTERLQNMVIPVILDGENAWEYFHNDGYEFLDLLYKRINDDPLIETVTFEEAVDSTKPVELPRLFAGSWINHNFKIWIGHSEDNTAWDMLYKTRQTLVDFQKQHPDFDAHKLNAAWRQIYIAEGSDWCWWYGEEHRGPHNEMFDNIFRGHLIAVYEILEINTPVELLSPIYKATDSYKARLPEQLITPEIDGKVSHFYEWIGSGQIKALDQGGAMHRVDSHIKTLWFAYDHENFYIRLDFKQLKNIDLLKEPAVVVDLYTPDQRTVRCHLRSDNQTNSNHISYAFSETFETAISRTFLFDDGVGDVKFRVSIVDGETELETFPGNETVSLHIPPKDYEMFWPS